MRRTDLEKMAQLARMKALRSRAELAAADARVREAEARLREVRDRGLEADPDDMPALVAATRWRVLLPELERPLQMSLALRLAERQAPARRAGRDDAVSETLDAALQDQRRASRSQAEARRLASAIERAVQSGRRPR